MFAEVIKIKTMFYFAIIMGLALFGAGIMISEAMTGNYGYKYQPYQGMVMKAGPSQSVFTSGRFQSPCEMCGCPPQTELVGYKGQLYDCRCPEVQGVKRADLECIWKKEQANGYTLSECAYKIPEYVETRDITNGINTDIYK